MIMSMNNSIISADLQRIHAALPVEKFRESEVLITGCAGFLGFYFLHYLVRYASELGITRVVGLDNFLLERPGWLSELEQAFPEVLEVRTFDIVKDSISTDRKSVV